MHLSHFLHRPPFPNQSLPAPRARVINPSILPPGSGTLDDPWGPVPRLLPIIDAALCGR